ncbi:MAG: ABC transporter ATP-binding protein [Gemmatimonadetes bacterium]|nr:ABC transporter ATP-binding protein [Gemmatimonadota bacterium]
MILGVELFKRLPGFTLDVKWEAHEGVVALFGPSGAGKSLTLQCLAGLVRPDGGLVSVRGRVIYDATHGINHKTRDRRLGMVFQGYALFPHLSVAENIAYGLGRWPSKQRKARVEEMLERLGLVAARDLRPAVLSGGQQQRVALGRALAVDPDLLLLDEPLAALDSPLRRALRDDLAVALRGFGKTAVVVTHDLGEACQLADQIVVYDNGRVLQQGAKSEVLARPASPAVASVLGIRNILEGEVLESTPEFIRLLWRGQELQAANWPERPDLPAAGTRVGFFVHPEHVRLMRKDRHEHAGARRVNRVDGRIVGETDLGASVALHFRADGTGEPPARGYDLEIELSRLVHEKLCVHYDRQWTVTVQPSAVQLLGGPRPAAPARRSGPVAAERSSAASISTLVHDP